MRLESLGMFFLYDIYIYTNEHLKMLSLRMETSGAAGKEDGGCG